MDVLTQLQEQANRMAAILFNLIGALQRDAPPVSLKGVPRVNTPGIPEEQTREMATSLVQAAKLFDTLVNALPVEEGGEAAQLQRLAELQEENEKVGEELALELQLAEEDLQQARNMFHGVADDCLRLK